MHFYDIVIYNKFTYIYIYMYIYKIFGASQVTLVVKNLPASAGDVRDLGSILGCKGPLEEGMVTHSSILAWRIPMDRGAWQAIVHSVAKSWTPPSLHGK